MWFNKLYNIRKSSRHENVCLPQGEPSLTELQNFAIIPKVQLVKEQQSMYKAHTYKTWHYNMGIEKCKILYNTRASTTAI